MARSLVQHITQLERQLAATKAAQEAKQREARLVEKQLRDAHASQRDALHVAIGELADTCGLGDVELSTLERAFQALAILLRDGEAFATWIDVYGNDVSAKALTTR